MCVDPDAIRRIDPQGIKVLGAKIVGKLNLSGVKVPFRLTLRRCLILELMDLTDAELPSLDLNGSYTGPIRAHNIDVANTVRLGLGFHARGIVVLENAKLGEIAALEGHFQWAPEPGDPYQSRKVALNLESTKIRGNVYLNYGFESHGGVELHHATIGGDLYGVSGHLINPGNIALDASNADIGGSVVLAGLTGAVAQQETVKGGFVQVDGVANFDSAHVSSNFSVDQVKFMGSGDKPHGLLAPGMVVKNAFVWGDVKLENGAQLDLSGASTQYFLMSRNWPAPGNLMIAGLTYSALGSLPGTPPWDVHTYLTFLRLQPSFSPQPYHELARSLRENGWPAPTPSGC